LSVRGMAPLSPDNHLARQAGIHTEEAAARTRRRRYFPVGDTIAEHKSLDPGLDEGESCSPSPFCRNFSRSPDRKSDWCGLSSKELAQVTNPYHRRTRRHTLNVGDAIDHAESVVSEAISESSEQFHLGKRNFVHDNRIRELLEEQAQLKAAGKIEPTAGVAMLELNTKGSLCEARGKKKFGDSCPYFAQRDHEGGVHTFGGETIRFLQKRKTPRADQLDHIFEDQLEPEKTRTARKIFADHIEKEMHATEDCPIGVSPQMDLDSKGFLGRSKGRGFDKEHMSSDPVSHKPDEPRSPGDLSAYGMATGGRRKYLLQSNLETGCRHTAREIKASPTLCVSASSPTLSEKDRPRNSTPYWQDDLPEHERAVKNEVPSVCKTSREADRCQKPRNVEPYVDNAWSALRWSQDRVDAESALDFVNSPNQVRAMSNEELRESEYRRTLDSMKRSFGNAHNKSELRLDYGDPPDHRVEHVTEIFTRVPEKKQKEAKDEKEARAVARAFGGQRDRQPKATVAWGHGHGRKRFDITDHVSPDYRESEGLEKYTSADMSVKLRTKKRVTPPFSVKDTPAKKADQEGYYADENGNTLLYSKSDHTLLKSYTKDCLHELLPDDLGSQTSNTVGLVGSRRKSEYLRPQSARRFPEKDFQKTRPRSATPRPPSSRTPISERPRWQK